MIIILVRNPPGPQLSYAPRSGKRRTGAGGKPGKPRWFVRYRPFEIVPYLTLNLRAQADTDPDAVVARAPVLMLDDVQRSRDFLIEYRCHACE
jgi:hypothetical protein